MRPNRGWIATKVRRPKVDSDTRGGRYPADNAVAISAGQTERLAACRSTSEKTDNRQQRDRAYQRYNQRRQAEVALINLANPKQRGQHETGQKRPDDADDDIQQQSFALSHELA